METDPTPAPAPEWALEMAKQHILDCFRRDGSDGMTTDEIIALLLASVRDAALREAAKRCDKLDVVLPSCSAPVRRAADKCRDAILSLVGTAPKDPPHA